ncbi:MAG: VWA domain-containing protein [Victivallales bacterium]|nr:VWA domain-containing protein [Victivallales bacterium]
MFSLVAIIPVLLHLLHRKRPKPILFAAMRFLNEAITKSRRSRRVTQCLALLMRVLIILLLATAFAQPLIKFSQFIPGNQRTVIIFLDSSASMHAMEGGRTLFEAAQTWCSQLISTLEEGDRMALLTPGSPVPETIFPLSSDKTAVLATLQELKPGYGQADICSLLSILLSKSPDTFRNSELHIFSDFQQDTWNQEQAPALCAKLSEQGAALFLNRCGLVTTGDAGIFKVEFAPPAIIGGNRVAANATLHANGQYVGSSILRIDGDGTEQNHTAVELMPGESSYATVTADTSGEAPQMCGTLRTDDDAFALNNCHYFSLPRVTAVEVLLVHGTAPSDTFFLKHALAPGGQATSLIQPREIDWATFLASDTGESKAVFICNPPDLEEAAIAKIKFLLSNGADILLFPGNSNGLTQEALQRFEAFKELTVRQNERIEAEKLEINLSNSDASLAMRLSRSLPPPWNFPVRTTLDILPHAGKGTPILQQGNYSFLSMFPQGNGRIWLFATDAARQWSDWPVTPSFLVCMQELSKELAQTALPCLETQVGSPLPLAWSGQETTLEFTVSGPTSASTNERGAVPPAPPSRVFTLTRASSVEPFIVQQLDTPGIHTISDGNRSMQIAVNLPVQERILNYTGEKQLLTTTGSLPTAYTTSPSELNQKTSELRQGSPLWPLLLCLAFFLSIIELLFANIRSRSHETPRLVHEILGSHSTPGGAK